MVKLKSKLLLAAVVISLLVVTVPLPANSATTSVSPSSATPGTVVTATGTGFSPSGVGACRILFDDDANLNPLQQGGDSTPAEEVGTCSVDSSGDATGTFPTPNRPAGGYHVAICNYCSGEFPQLATTSFSITAPTTTTAPPTTSTTQPTTTTSQPPTTTTRPQATTTTTTTSASTTSTTIPSITEGIPSGASIFPLPLGPPTLLNLGLPDFGLDLDFTPRCDIPEGSNVIDFEDLPLGPFDPGDDWLTNNNVENHNVYEAEIEVAPNPFGTASVDRGLRADTSSGVGLELSTPVRFVGVFVGLPEPSSRSATVRLSAWTGDDVFIDQIELGSDPTPTTNCLMVDLPGDATIKHLIVETFGADGIPIHLDSVFYGYDFDHPATGEQQEATIAITAPWPDTTIPNTPMDVTMNVLIPDRTGGNDTGNRTTVTLAAPAADGSGVDLHRADLTRVDSLNPAFFRYHGVVEDIQLPPGRQPLVAVLSGTHYARDGIFVEVFDKEAADRRQLAGALDVVPVALEVTQGIRRAIPIPELGANAVEGSFFIADKHTTVRAYARLQPTGDVEIESLPFDAQLYGYRGATRLPGSPLSPSNPDMAVPVLGDGIETLRQLRSSGAKSWNFELPRSWTAETDGDVKLILEVNPRTTNRHVVEPDGADGNQNRIGLTGVGFTRIEPRPVTLFLIEDHGRVPADQVPDGAEVISCEEESCRIKHSPDFRDIANALKGLRTLVPISDRFPLKVRWVRLSHRNADIDDPPEWTEAETNKLIDALGDSYEADNQAFAIMLFASNLWDEEFAGCSWGRAGTGAGTLFHAAACPDTVAHEATHTLGVSHVSLAHNEAGGGGGDPRYEDDHGELGGQSPEDVFGWDYTESRAIPATGDPHPHAFMSYGAAPRWVSPETWETGIRALRLADGVVPDSGWTVSLPYFIDGFDLATATHEAPDSDPVEVPAELAGDAPLNMILGPIHRDVLAPGQSIELLGVAQDSEASPYPAESVEWFLDGEHVANGHQVPALAIPEGRHTLTLRSPGGEDSVEVVASFDDDSDGLADLLEEEVGLDPTIPDDPRADEDGDGLSTLQELRLGTNPFDPDTDGDTYPDWVERDGGSDPIDPESVPLGLMHWPDGEPIPRIGDDGAVASGQPSRDGSDDSTALWFSLALLVLVVVGGWVWLVVKRPASSSGDRTG